MDFQFSFKHMDTSEGLQDYAMKKIRDKVDKLAPRAVEAHVTFSVSRHEHYATCLLTGVDGLRFQVEQTSPDMYASVDMLVDKLVAQLKKHKEKVKGNKKGGVSMGDFAGSAPDDDEAEVDAGDIVKLEQKRSH